MTYHKTFGPAVWREGGVFRSACIKKFSGGLICCIECSGDGTCRADRASPRAIPDTGDTPDWCRYLARAIQDAKTMEAFEALGLNAGRKADVMKVVRALPKEFRPKGARALGLGQLHSAVARAVAAGWEMSK